MSAAEIKELNVKRGALKRSLTASELTVNGVNDDTNIASVDPADRLEKLQGHWSDFQSIQARLELLSADDAEKLKSNYDERATFESRYYTLSGKLKQLIERLNSTNSRETTPARSLANSSTDEDGQIIANIKLPTINLPSFSGSYDTWVGFSDTFNSIVHNNDKISDIQKLHYLKSCLKNEAATVIAALETSSRNYMVAWELLKERYDNQRFIVESHAKAILELPTLSKEFSIRSLLDHVQKHFRALEALKVPVETWDVILIAIIKSKLNQFNRDKWEDSAVDSKLPTMKQMVAFLQRRAHLEETRLEEMPNKTSNKLESTKQNSKPIKKSNFQHNHMATRSKPVCFCCQGDHAIYSCEQFLKLSIQERINKVKALSLCMNCLLQNHKTNNCRLGPCRKCKVKHNSLLHLEDKETETSAFATSDESINMQACNKSHSLISTALVNIKDSQGNFHPCRVLLDSGSQSHYITERKASFLNLKARPVNVNVSGLSLTQTTITKSVSTTLMSRVNKFERNLELFVVPRITSKLPSISINRSILTIPKNISLADPEFHKPADIDALIGVQLFYKLLRIGQIAIPGHDAILQKTHLGWIIAGNIYQGKQNVSNETCHLTINSNISNSDLLTKFWELEQVPNKKFLSSEEQACENHFVQNTKRDITGRYIVKLPFNENKDKLGQSFNVAKRRFHYLENKFEKNPSLKKEYSTFLKEYENLGHMSEVSDDNAINSGYFLPHHAVVKEGKLTSKIRVVFDASAKDSNGISLNNALMVGPTIQDDLFTIYVRFRSFPFALTADLEKMYRQVLLDPEDSNFQKIIWRENPTDSIKIFKLNTVTYGTGPAPFLATRVLSQLATDEEHSHPLSAQILKRDFYVDDLLTGANTLTEALNLRDELIRHVEKGGFTLRKWASNDPSLVMNIDNKSNDSLISLNSMEKVKTLGISWLPDNDLIVYAIQELKFNTDITKRSILSDVAKLFDPLGLLSPIIVYAKLFIQLLWKLNVSWDQPLNKELQIPWLEFKNQLPLINQIQFDRCTVLPDASEIQLHGFCDASEKAYAACIYLRSVDKSGKSNSQLVCSKSRIAPIQPVTLPRLELCAALLLARLFSATKQALNHLNIEKQFFWSDSTIALYWIKTPPHNLKTFVANRVSAILEVTRPVEWRHVSTQDNPADLPSRGRTPEQFTNDHIWRTGPLWLMQNESTWPNSSLVPETIPELRKSDNSKVFTITDIDESILNRFSSSRKMVRVIAYCRRFIYNCKKKNIDKVKGELSNVEYDAAHDCIIKTVQSSAFPKEINQLQDHQIVDNKSKLLCLNPFLDKGILKVGGRLTHSDLNYNQKHPIVLPRNHHFTSVIIRENHHKLKHAGVQSTLYSVREFYWPINGRNITRKIIRDCLICFRVNPRGVEYMMGDLPADRLNQAPPFSIVGIDYCGPFFIKEKRYRNTKKLKVYVAVYVCFVTRAVHLELVSDLTSDAFIGSLKKLFARRGNASKIYSDNATNFVGANRQLLKELENFLNSEQHKKLTSNFLNSKGIEWKFIPPRAPHFGGLWEAAVKSFKHHFVRAVGDTALTFEQLQTYVYEIEAILNSRPLTPLSSDPNDFSPLTPGHFLIGRPLTSLPERDLRDVKQNRLSLWQHAQQMRQHFWHRWTKEYLNELTSRSKWQSGSSDVKIGTLILLREDNLPPMQWSLGRVTEVHPGPDGVTRVVTVKTPTGLYKRSVKNVYPLPIEYSRG